MYYKNKWELNKELFERAHFYAIYWFGIGFGLLFIGMLLMLGVPIFFVNDNHYSHFNTIFLNASIKILFIQTIIFIFISSIYAIKKELKGTDIITRVLLNNTNLIIITEKYLETFHRFRPLNTDFISEPCLITLENYEIILETNRFIKIQYQDGNKLKKIKILIEYFENSESLISILKENANNINIKKREYQLKFLKL